MCAAPVVTKGCPKGAVMITVGDLDRLNHADDFLNDSLIEMYSKCVRVIGVAVVLSLLHMHTPALMHAATTTLTCMCALHAACACLVPP